jgi:hypothetical protein
MLEFLMWVIFIYFALLLIGRYVVPFLLKRFVKRMQRKFTNRFEGGFYDQRQQQEGEVNIDNAPETPVRERKPLDDDDYVDFEEIKDNDPQTK